MTSCKASPARLQKQANTFILSPSIPGSKCVGTSKNLSVAVISSVVHAIYRSAAHLALQEIEDMEIDLVILQSRSPTCGVNQIYDGSFTGKLIQGQGIFAEELIKAGYVVKDSEDFP